MGIRFALETPLTDCRAHRGDGAVVQGLVGKQHRVFNEDSAGPQDEGGEQVDVDVVPGAAELSESSEKQKEERMKH